MLGSSNADINHAALCERSVKRKENSERNVSFSRVVKFEPHLEMQRRQKILAQLGQMQYCKQCLAQQKILLEKKMRLVEDEREGERGA